MQILPYVVCVFWCRKYLLIFRSFWVFLIQKSFKNIGKVDSIYPCRILPGLDIWCNIENSIFLCELFTVRRKSNLFSCNEQLQGFWVTVRDLVVVVRKKLLLLAWLKQQTTICVEHFFAEQSQGRVELGTGWSCELGWSFIEQLLQYIELS